MLIEILIVIIVFILGWNFPGLLNLQAADLKKLKWLWGYHLLFGFIYYYLALSQGGSDSLKYWLGAKEINNSQAIMTLFELKGTRAMYAINYIPSGILDLSFFSGTMLYCLIGFMGLSLFYKVAVELIPYNTKKFGIMLFPAIFYLPNLHIWSTAIGKDTLLFFAISLFSYGMLNLSKRIFLIVLSLVLSFVVRPHIMLFLSLSFSMAYLLKASTKIYIKAFLFTLLLGIGIAVLPTVLEYSKMEELSFESYNEFAERGVRNLSRAHTSSSVDVSSYPFPLKLFTFLYRPSIMDISGFTSIIVVIENLFLLALSFIVIRYKFFQAFKASPFVIKGLVFFLIIGTVTFSMSLGNLGIMLRMRNMFLPGMLIFLLWCLSYKQEMMIRDEKRRLKGPNNG